MTISAKLSDVGGLEFVVSDPTDTDDVGGFSDTITTGAKTAKFSDTSVMQANVGKIIGVSQLKINSGAGGVVRSRSLESNVGWGNPNDAFDGNDTTFAAIAGGGALIIDFTSIATTILKIAHGTTSGNSTINVQISDDDISYTDLGNFFTTSTSSTGETVDLGTQTWRYVKVERVSGTASTKVFEVFEELSSESVTVRVRSSATIDTADGTVLITDQVMTPNQTLTFNTALLLTGAGQFVTLEYVSFVSFAIPINLSQITSVKEV